MRYYDYPSKEREDVFVELADLDKVKYGEVFKGRILLEVSITFLARVPCSIKLHHYHIYCFMTYLFIYDPSVLFQNRSNQVRTLKAVVSCNSIYYTGILANLVKKSQGEFELQPGQSKLEVKYYNCILHYLLLYYNHPHNLTYFYFYQCRRNISNDSISRRIHGPSSRVLYA